MQTEGAQNYLCTSPVHLIHILYAVDCAEAFLCYIYTIKMAALNTRARRLTNDLTDDCEQREKNQWGGGGGVIQKSKTSKGAERKEMIHNIDGRTQKGSRKGLEMELGQRLGERLVESWRK